jgi:hypothetical protein
MNPASIEPMVQLLFTERAYHLDADDGLGVRRPALLNSEPPVRTDRQERRASSGTKQVLAIIARKDVALATGHISAAAHSLKPAECIIVTHPTQGIDVSIMNIEQQMEAANRGAFLEYC